MGLPGVSRLAAARARALIFRQREDLDGGAPLLQIFAVADILIGLGNGQ